MFSTMNKTTTATTATTKDPKPDTMARLPQVSMVFGSDEKTVPGAISVGEYSDSTSPSDTTTSTTCEDSEIICDSGNESSSRHHCPSVRFGDIEIREHAMILGDHPDATDGPPLTIEWKSQLKKIDSVDNYEATRKNRRHEWDLRVTPSERNMYLRRVVGVPSEEIYRATFRAEDDRKKRIDTIKGQKNEKFDIFVQSLQRKTMRVLNRTTHPGKLLKSRGTVRSDYEGTSNIDLILPTQKTKEQHHRRHTIHDIPTLEPPPPSEETISMTRHNVPRLKESSPNSSPKLLKPVLKKTLHSRSSTM